MTRTPAPNQTTEAARLHESAANAVLTDEHATVADFVKACGLLSFSPTHKLAQLEGAL